MRGVRLGSLLVVLSLFTVAAVGAGCGDEQPNHASGATSTGGGGGTGGTGGESMTSGTGGNATPQGQTSLFVEVFDNDTQKPLHKARVRIAERLRLTDDLGHVLLDNLVPGTLVLRIDALGYVGVSANVSAIRETHAGQRVYLKKRDVAAITMDAKIGGTAVASTGDAEVEILPNSLVGVDGKPVTEKVMVTVTPIDPGADLNVLPGTAETISINAEAPTLLASLSMLDVVVEIPAADGSGELSTPVFFAPGKHATVKRRIPIEFTSTLQNGDSIQAYRLAPSSGVFGANELGTIESVPNEPGQLRWSGEISQTGLFSVARKLTAPGCFQVHVNAGGAARAGVFVHASASAAGSVARGFTDNNGEVTLRVPAGVPVDVRLPMDPAGVVQTLTIATEASVGCQPVVIDIGAPCGIAGASEPCNAPSVGGCEPRRHCDSLAWGSCTNERSPNVEVCNGIDDDCNGQVDEELVDYGFRCDTGQPGICAFGFVNGCVKGKTLCKQVATARLNESCNGLDDNCDGAIDEGNPGGGGNCQTGLSGTCASGVLMCAGAKLVCKASAAVPEQCNGVDDDCDGDVDEEYPGSGQVCSTGLLGVCAGGTTACVNGAPQCVQNVPAAPSEICATTNDDDNCDGQTNEGPLCCSDGTTCMSGVCANNECQTAATCFDTVINDVETDIDCGGGVCGPCGVGKSCGVAMDCVSLVCTVMVCQAATCLDMVKNGVETDKDCGGVACPKCGVGDACILNADCTTGQCTNNTCVGVTCSDSVQNQDESDIDCGGQSCPGCQSGQKCIDPADCASNMCSGGICN